MTRVFSKYFSIRLITLLLITLLSPLAPKTFAQEKHYVMIDSISIEGNNHTKAFVIERELLFKKTEIYEVGELAEMTKNSRNMILNTNLYILADVTWIEIKPNHVIVFAKVIEKWYVWPVPILKLADRNFKQWAEKDYKLNRTEYGVRLNTNNFRGRNETLRVTLIGGYTKNITVQYLIPFLDKTGKVGLDLSSSYRINKEIWYLTRNNELQFYQNFKDILIRRFENNFALTTRRNNYITERFELEYNLIKIRDTVNSPNLNPNFLLAGLKQQEFFVRHVFHYERRDNKFYPLNGYYFRNELGVGSINSDTSNVEMLRESFEFGLYKRLYKKLYLSAYGKFKGSNEPFPYIPYNNFKALGYTDHVRGYEQYVIDGHAFVLAKINLKFALIHQYMLKVPIKLNKKTLRVPFGIYLNGYCDYGKVWNNQWKAPTYNYNNTLIRQDLIGYGGGLDFVLMNDKVLKLEYSLNKIGEGNFNMNLVKTF